MARGKSKLEQLYKDEYDPHVKERLFLILRVVGDGMVPSRVAKELRRSRTWASDWMCRYRQEGRDGLYTRPRSGRPTRLPEDVAVRIQNILKENRRQGWTTRQAYELIAKEGGVKYHEKYIYQLLLHRWGFKEKVPRKEHINTAASDEQKQHFKKMRRKS